MKLLLSTTFLATLLALGATLSSKAAAAQRLGEEESNGRELTTGTAQVIQFQLFDSNKDDKVMNLVNGTSIESADPAFTVVAIVNGTTTRSVRFGLNKNSRFRTEDAAPYALCENRGFDYFKCSALTYGWHTVTATPCTRTSGGGRCGPTARIVFEIRVPSPSASPTSYPSAMPSPSTGFCNWGPLGTAASSTCSGGAQGGDWCNFHRIHCGKCGGRWCNDQPDPAPSPPKLGGFCNWGYDGTKETATCYGGREYGAEGTDKDFCHLSPDHCTIACNGRWCNDYLEGPTTAPTNDPGYPAEYCNYGYDGTGATSTCVGGPMGGPWCNANKGRCEGTAGGNCNGKWCSSNVGP